MYWRSWPLEVILNVPLSNPGDFPHPDEILMAVGNPEPDVAVGIPGPDEFVGVALTVDVVTPAVQSPGRHWEYH
jgi:hypothetical protein